MSTFDTIIYTNYFKIENKIFAFRKKELFEITSIPLWMPLQDNSGSKGYWINSKWYSLSKIKTMIVNENKTVDIGQLQWYKQVELTEVFNL